MSKHTSGPWAMPGSFYAEREASVISICARAMAELRLSAAAISAGCAAEIAEANFRLIAAAPDMLDALKAVCYMLAAWRDGDIEAGELEELKYRVVDRIIEAVEPGFDGGSTSLDEVRAALRDVAVLRELIEAQSDCAFCADNSHTARGCKVCRGFRPVKGV